MDRIPKNSLIKIAKKEFEKKYGFLDFSIAVAPGRINIIGEHTDYNNGLAMPIAINRWICCVSKKRTDSKINAYSVELNKSFNSNINNSEPNELWEKYVAGCIKVVNHNYNVASGFDILIVSSIPMGYGLSSSAALEISLIGSMIHEYGFKVDLSLILNLASKVENQYLKINSGKLDQYASLYSIKDKPMIIDFSNLTHRYVNVKIQNSVWILINSMVSRELVDSKYNQRVDECKLGLKKINEQLLEAKLFNELSLNDLNIIKKEDVLYKRIYHVISENIRVLAMEKALRSGNLNKIGEILDDSHKSLSENYEVSCAEIEDIIKISNKQKGFYGGRIMGGGFGGCTINLVDEFHKKKFIDKVKSEFYEKNGFSIDAMTVDFSSGLNVID